MIWFAIFSFSLIFNLSAFQLVRNDSLLLNFIEDFLNWLFGIFQAIYDWMESIGLGWVIVIIVLLIVCCCISGVTMKGLFED